MVDYDVRVAAPRNLVAMDASDCGAIRVVPYRPKKQGTLCQTANTREPYGVASFHENSQNVAFVASCLYLSLNVMITIAYLPDILP